VLLHQSLVSVACAFPHPPTRPHRVQQRPTRLARCLVQLLNRPFACTLFVRLALHPLHLAKCRCRSMVLARQIRLSCVTGLPCCTSPLCSQLCAQQLSLPTEYRIVSHPTLPLVCDCVLCSLVIVAAVGANANFGPK